MKSIVIFTIAFVLVVPTTAFGAGGYWEDEWGKLLTHSPTVCVFQPDDSRIDEQRWKRWYSDAKTGIDTWENVLTNSGSGNWQISVIEVPLEKKDLLNYNTCDISIHFVKQLTETSGNCMNAFGCASSSGYIRIVYSDFGYCGKEFNSEYNIMINTYCFTDNFTRSKQMANTVQHEFGHTLGLGHYRGYDSISTQSWYDSKIGAPSIMAWIEPNEEVRQITQNDVNKIREYYGSNGFAKKTSSTPIFNEPYVPEPVIPVAGTINLQITGNSVQKMITGYIPDTLYKRGTYLEIEIQRPNGSTESKAVTVSKTLHSFKHNLTFNQSSQEGLYTISLKFDGTVFKKIPINVSKNSVSAIASNSVSSKYLENITIKENKNKYTVTSYLSSSYPSNQIRIIAENECPFKKQVFQQDFRFNTGKPISFSFNQLSNGKPPVCIIHFTVSNFEGQKLDSVKAEYNTQTKQQKTLTTETKQQKTLSSETTKSVAKISSKPLFTENQKSIMSKKIDSTSVSILKLKDGMDATWNHLKDAETKYTESQSKTHLEKAWEIYNQLYSQRNTEKTKLDGIVSNYLNLEEQTSTTPINYFDQFSKSLSNTDSKLSQIGSKMKYISQELDYAKKASKQCSWFWC